MTQKTITGIVGTISVIFLMFLCGCENPISAPATNGADQVDPTSFYSPTFPLSPTRNYAELTTAPPTTAPEQHTHTYQSSITPATCEEGGYTTYTCECGNRYHSDHTEPLTHSYSEWTLTTPPTCQEEGIEQQTCSRCLKENSRSISVIAHTYECVEARAATTTEEGLEVYRCAYCKGEFTKVFPKLSAADTDLCGESLLGKPLPHDEHAAFTGAAFAMWNNRLTHDISRSAGIPLLYADYWDFLHSWAADYYYITQPFPYTVHSPNGEIPTFACWGSEEEYALQDTAYAIVFQILSDLGIDETTTQREAICRINEWLCANKDYDYSHDPYTLNNTLYYALTSPTGVCRQYAMAFQALCLGAGIECRYYSSGTMRHAWNSITFSDGSVLWVDTCWNDNGDNPSQYLLISAEEMSKTHTW